jgi:DNA-binding winged helix-turn-helix (wHTH) protein/TolB-like protein
VDSLRTNGPATRRSFGPFTLDTDRAELTRDGAPVPLRPKVHALLAYFVERAGSTVSKQELLDAVWPGLVVTDDSLTQAISELRAALGDDGPALIRTVPRRGYRLDAEVRAPMPAPVVPPPAGAAVLPAAAPVSVPHAAPQVTAHAARPWLVRGVAGAFGAGLVALLLLGLAQMGPAPPTPLDAALGSARSIVVLPFADLSDPPAPHLAHAIGHDLTTDLGRHTDVQVLVHATATVPGTDAASLDPRRIGREVGGRHVLAGSVQRQGEAVVVSVRLLRADTAQLLWSARFDYPTVADWAGRREISAQVANLLSSKVAAAARADTVRRKANGAAVDHWMRGSWLLDKLQTGTDQPQAKAELQQARAHFEAALALEPDSVQALALLSRTHSAEVLFRWSADRKASLALATTLARRALAIDPNDLVALKSLAGAQMFDGDLDAAMNTSLRLLEINPSDANANRALAATLFFHGRWEETLRQLEIAGRLNPLDNGHMDKVHSIAAGTLIALRRYDEAIDRAKRLAAVNPQSIQPYVYLAAAHAHRGELAAAREAAAELLHRQPGYMIGGGAPYRGSMAPAYLAGMQHLYDGLRLAGAPERPASAPR